MGDLERSGPSSRPSEGGVRPWDPPAYQGIGYEPPSLQDRVEQALDVLQRRRWIVLVTCVLVIAAAVAYASTQETSYTASSLVLISEEGSRATQSGVNDQGEPFARSDRSMESELILLRNSHELARRVGERLLQQQVLSSEGRTLPILIAPDSTLRDLEAVTSHVRGAVAFEPEGRDAKVIRITATSDDPEEAVLIAGLYLEEYINHSRQASRARIAASRQFLEQQAMLRRSELHDLERRIQEYQREEGNMTLDNVSEALASRLAEAEARRDEAQLELQQRQATYESLEEQLAAINPDQLSERVGSAAEQEIEALQTRIAELEISKRDIQLQGSTITAADSAQIFQIEDRLEQLRSDVAGLSESFIDELMAAGGLGASEGVRRVEDLQLQMAELRIEMSGLDRRIDVLSDRIVEYEAELRTIPGRAMTLAQLQRDRSYEEHMYQYLTQQLQEARIQEESELGYATRVSQAAISARPIEPRTRRTIILSLLLGLMLGAGLAFVRDRLDRRMYKPDDLREKGYSVVSVVPNLKPIVEEHHRNGEVVQNGHPRLSTTLVSQTDAMSAAAEAYRSVRTNILRKRNGQALRTLLVTSPGMGDGKSVTAANIAIVMAQAGFSTLLIDADLRRPRLHRLFDASQAPGLGDALKNDYDVLECIQETSIDHLHLLSSGPVVSKPSEVPVSSEIEALLGLLEDQYDFIIVDTPPVLASSDAIAFSPECDGTIVVARAGTTTDAELEYAMNSLDDAGAHVVGTLFNGFDLSMAYGYKLRYRHYTKYGPYSNYGVPDD